MKHRVFVYTGEAIPKIEKENHDEFIMIYQRSILLSLVKRKLLTQSQFEKCIEKLQCK